MIIVISKPYKWIFTIILTISLTISLLFTVNRIWSAIQPQVQITLDNKITFGYPMNIKMNDFYSNLPSGSLYVKTSSILGKEISRNKTFSSDKADISFNYPNEFNMGLPIEMEGEIEYHISFSNPSIGANGFIQIWELRQPLKNFLEQSKAYAMVSYLSFVDKEITVNNMQGYFWNTVLLSNNSKLRGLEVFLEKDKKVYRISYFLPERKYGKKQEKLFWNMVNSLEIKNP